MKARYNIEFQENNEGSVDSWLCVISDNLHNIKVKAKGPTKGVAQEKAFQLLNSEILKQQVAQDKAEEETRLKEIGVLEETVSRTRPVTKGPRILLVFIMLVLLGIIVLFATKTFFGKNEREAGSQRKTNPAQTSSHQPVPGQNAPTKDSASKEPRNDASTSNISLPIENLFNAWAELDLNLYMNQWDANGAQYSRKFVPRSYEDIYSRRKSLFAKLQSVEVVNYEIQNIQRQGDHTASLKVKYSMVYYFKNGKHVSESDILEKYDLAYDDSMGQWLIQANYDYIE